MKKNRTLPVKAAFFLLGLAALVLLLIGAMVYRASSSRVNALSADLAAKQAKLAGIQARLRQEPQLQREYDSLQASLAILEPALPTSSYIPTFLGQVEQLALATGNKVDGVKPEQEKPGPKPAATATDGDQTGPQPAAGAAKEPPAKSLTANYQRMPVEVVITGDFWSTVSFLKRMATFPKMVAITEVSVTPEHKGMSMTHPQLSARINMIALVHKGGEQWKNDAKK